MLAATDVTQYDVKFFNKNLIPEGGAIHITMPSTITPITSCLPSYGLEDIDEQQLVTCDITIYPLIVITNFKEIKRNTLIEVLLLINNGVGSRTTVDLTIETYYAYTTTNKTIDTFTGNHLYDIALNNIFNSLTITMADSMSDATDIW